MAINYVNFQNLAERLIRENGRAVSLVKDSTTLADPAQPWRDDDGMDMSITATAVIVPMEHEDSPDASKVRRGDYVAYVAELDPNVTGEVIEEYDRLVDGTDQYEIRSVELIRPGNERIMYVIGLGK